MTKPLLIGAHTSTQGGLQNAIIEAHEIGATTFQMFTSNQKRWDGREMTDEVLDLWFKTLEEYPMESIMSHDSYLINLGSPNPELLAKSHQAFKNELKRCHLLKLTFLNFHPGAATTGTVEECLDTIVKSLLSLEKETSEYPTRLLLETTAGQGSCVGYLFEELAYIIERVQHKIPIGVCIDTCHIFAAGYDIRTPEGWDHMLKQFNDTIGLKHLYALHVNDSMKPLGSRKDRHAPLGEGEIGIECFKAMMSHPKLKSIPKYLETPDGPPLWKKEIAHLRQFAN